MLPISRAGSFLVNERLLLLLTSSCLLGVPLTVDRQQQLGWHLPQLACHGLLGGLKCVQPVLWGYSLGLSSKALTFALACHQGELVSHTHLGGGS